MMQCSGKQNSEDSDSEGNPSMSIWLHRLPAMTAYSRLHAEAKAISRPFRHQTRQRILALPHLKLLRLGSPHNPCSFPSGGDVSTDIMTFHVHAYRIAGNAVSADCLAGRDRR